MRIPFDVIRDLLVLVELRRPFQLRRGPVRLPIPPPPPEWRERIRRQKVALRISGVEAATNPGVSWEVHVGPPGFAPSQRSLVGTFALFSAGLRDRRQHFHPAEFLFPLDAEAVGDPTRLQVIFVPVSGFEERGDPRRIQPRVPVNIGSLALVADAPMRQPPIEEQERLRREEDMR